MSNVVAFTDLHASDLLIGTTYRGGTQNTFADDPLAKLAPVGNQGGFRYNGSPANNTVRFAVVFSSGDQEEWPDHLDEDTGILTYYGDNRHPGKGLLETRRKGNLLLKNVFAAAYGGRSTRLRIPPFVLFEKADTGRDVRFRGLLAPGVAGSVLDDDLKAAWRDTTDGRFENYEARFTVLNTKTIPRIWIDAVVDGVPSGDAPDCPQAWRTWLESGQYDVLPAELLRS